MASIVVAGCNPSVIFAKRALKDTDRPSQTAFCVSLSAASVVSESFRKPKSEIQLDVLPLVRGLFNATSFNLVYKR